MSIVRVVGFTAAIKFRKFAADCNAAVQHPAGPPQILKSSAPAVCRVPLDTVLTLSGETVPPRQKARGHRGALNKAGKSPPAMPTLAGVEREGVRAAGAATAPPRWGQRSQLC